jgi:hypothetical protein
VRTNFAGHRSMWQGFWVPRNSSLNSVQLGHPWLPKRGGVSIFT